MCTCARACTTERARGVVTTRLLPRDVGEEVDQRLRPHPRVQPPLGCEAVDEQQRLLDRAHREVGAPRHRQRAEAGSGDFVSLWAGQGLGMSRTMAAGELLDKLTAETDEVLGRLGLKSSR